MFNRYEVQKALGQGSFCTAYLVKHISLGQERVMKIYQKDPGVSAADPNEAAVLKGLHHPGIPLIYDLEEDENFFYVIEEYVCGETLQEFLLSQKMISEDFFYNFSKQLCDIFRYLHSHPEFPVIYRDLKPEHLILCGSRIRLIDFNISASALSSENNLDHFGNLAFSPPESYYSSEITCASDIYSIGRILEYLSSYLEKPPNRKLRTIIRKATEEDPLLRYQSTEELILALDAEQKNMAQPHLTKNIVIAGSHPGCGTTHLAISLVSYLNYMGISAVYYEKNKTDSLRNAAEAQSSIIEQDGYYHYRYFTGLPDYGPGVLVPEIPAQIRVFDFGFTRDLSFPPETDPDLILCVGTGSIWRQNSLSDIIDQLKKQDAPVKIIGNLCSRQRALQLAVRFGTSIYHYPVDDRPFCVTGQKKRFFRFLLRGFL